MEVAAKEERYDDTTLYGYHILCNLILCGYASQNTKYNTDFHI